jgi:hypothetical protein
MAEFRIKKVKYYKNNFYFQVQEKVGFLKYKDLQSEYVHKDRYIFETKKQAEDFLETILQGNIKRNLSLLEDVKKRNKEYEKN